MVMIQPSDRRSRSATARATSSDRLSAQNAKEVDQHWRISKVPTGNIAIDLA
jgi:hypothetical protein